MRYSVNKGFSLLEVLIALTILATALMALSGSVNQTFRNHVYLKDKTFAHYVAMRRLAEVRLQPEWPNEGTTRGDIKMLNNDWKWRQIVSKTTEANLRRVEISVANKSDEEYFLTTITAFVGKPSDGR